MRVLQVGSGKQRFPVASVFLLLFIVGALSVLTQTARAAYYAVTYSGGTATSQTGSFPYSLNSNGWWGGLAGSVSPFFPVSSMCSGTITSTFVWTKTSASDQQPPPTKAVVYQETDVSVSGAQTFTIDNGISGATQFGRKYSIKDDPGASFTVTLSPSASGSTIIFATVLSSVRYRASASPLEVWLGGGIGPNWDKKYLIGQQVIGSLFSGGLTPTSYNWTATGGDPFKNWAVTWVTSQSRSKAELIALGSETGSTFLLYFKKPIPQATITCTAHLAVPLGAVPAAGFDVTVSGKCEVKRPDSASFSAYTVQNTSQYPGPGSILLPNAPANGVGFVPPLMFYGVLLPGQGSVGIRWDGYIQTSSATPNPWGGDGGWNWVQKALVYRYQTIQGQNQWILGNGIEGLDSTYPYEPAPYFSAQNSNPGTYPANNITHTDGDSPANTNGQGLTRSQANDHFQTWMMYRPYSPNPYLNDSSFVPIKKIFWQWSGDAQFLSGTWTLISSNSGWTFGDDFPNFPEWDYVLGGANIQWVP